MSKYQYLKTECSFVVRFKNPIKYFNEEYKKYNGSKPKNKKDVEVWLSKLLKSSYFPDPEVKK
jgi:hypothetical protein